MDDDAEKDLLAPRLFGSGPQSRAQEALVLRESALYMGPLAIEFPGESPFEAPTVATLGPDPRASGIEADHAGANPQKASAEVVVVFAVVGSVRKDLIQSHSADGFGDRGSKVRRVIAGASADFSGEPEVAGDMASHRQLGVIGVPEDPGIGSLGEIVQAGLPDLQARRINGAALTVSDQAAFSTIITGGVQESIETPFFRRRW